MIFLINCPILFEIIKESVEWEWYNNEGLCMSMFPIREQIVIGGPTKDEHP